jgi:hypothetical protein
VGGPLGPYLAYVPDGEIGDRRYWIEGIAHRVFNGHPEIETCRQTGKWRKSNEPVTNDSDIARWSWGSGRCRNTWAREDFTGVLGSNAGGACESTRMGPPLYPMALPTMNGIPRLTPDPP